MKKLTITASRYPIEKVVAEFQSHYTIELWANALWFRVCFQKAYRADGFTLTDEISDCTLSDFQRTTKFTVA